MRPLLALHVRDDRPHAPHYQVLLDDLNAGFRAGATAAGWSVELVATADAEHDQILDRAAGAGAVVVLGGEDVTPALYGGRAVYPGSGHHEPRADAIAIAVIQQAIATGIPLLGICRGHQLLNVALGGTLVEHMHGHRARSVSPYVRTRVSRAAVDDPDLLDGEDALCTHHQAVRDVGEGLRVIARAADGVIEALAHERAPALGVQWHPEHPDVSGTQLVRLLELIAPDGTLPPG
ncbi:gamma-glutamyl-gamma-aminobutyrate hydrolase family protein [Microbacterium gorillae]|uniref:gamma-glutamyl-gamma-aminobutyrate hydrolase family protein n=1 Tax=Microbacterium gorillae TaxID=1231063 RepID=UPI00069468B1|nr:gamma-glutamyl-gamma-aminobutyrate hydrolase family protein [Microbacterium gorillae]